MLKIKGKKVASRLRTCMSAHGYIRQMPEIGASEGRKRVAVVEMAAADVNK